MRTVQRCQEVIHRVAGNLVSEKKKKIMEGEKSGYAFEGKDLLSLLCSYTVLASFPFTVLTDGHSEVQCCCRPTTGPPHI